MSEKQVLSLCMWADAYLCLDANKLTKSDDMRSNI